MSGLSAARRVENEDGLQANRSNPWCPPREAGFSGRQSWPRWSLSVCESAELWRDKIGPETPGPFPLVRPFSGEFRFGWSDIEAASAKARLWYSGDEIIVEVEGGTNGLARTLWQLDARHRAVILKEGLKPVEFSQLEKYTKKRVRTEAVFKPDGLWRIRAVTPDPKNVARWKRIKVEPVRDIISAMLLIRSQISSAGSVLSCEVLPTPLGPNRAIVVLPLASAKR